MENFQEELLLSASDKTKQLSIMRFLALNKFTQCTLDILQTIAALVQKSLQGNLFHMSVEYAKIAAPNENPESIRGQLGYYIKANYDRFRKSLLTKYEYDIDKFYGVKSFIDQVAIAYELFGGASY